MAVFDAVRTSDVGSDLEQGSLLAIFTVKILLRVEFMLRASL